MTRLVSVLMALLIAACGGTTSEPPRPEVDTVQFDYVGYQTGSFSAVAGGAGDAAPGDALRAVYTRSDRFLRITAVANRRYPLVDSVTIFLTGPLHRLKPGTFRLDDNACYSGELCVSGIAVVLGVNRASEYAEHYSVLLRPAQVTLSKVTPTRLQGTFSGDDVFGELTVLNGSFDVGYTVLP